MTAGSNKRGTLMNRKELKSLMQGISAAVPTPFDDECRLDLGVARELTQWWVEQGLGTNTAMIKVCSAWGEGPTLGDDEWPHLLRTVVNAGGPGANFMCGLKSKDTLHTIEDARKAQDLGANSLQIELPYNHRPGQDQYVRHFTMISDAIDIGIMIYNTYWFGCDPITAETMLRLEDAEQVAAVKWSFPTDEGYDQMREFAGIFNVIDNSGQQVRCHKNGGRGFVSAYVAANPAHDIKVWGLLEASKYDEAQDLIDRANDAIGPVRQKVAANSRGHLVKGMMEIIGRPAGPPRLPTERISDEEMAELRAAMEKLGWV